jgi:DNA-binding GntR family transcriptional regulator
MQGVFNSQVPLFAMSVEIALVDLQPSPEQPMTERAYAHIREQIVTFVAQPGEVLSESTISRALDMSRTPVREALRRLQGEGLVKLDIRYGARVADVSVEDVDHAYRVLEMLEGLAARLAAESDDPLRLEKLNECANRLELAGADHDLVAWIDADRAVHRQIWVTANNPVLLRQLEGIYPLIERVRHIHLHETPNDARVSLETERHLAVISAICAGDGATAERLARDLFHRARIDNVRLLRTWIAPLRNRF